MECTTSYCPNPPCPPDGQRGFGAHLVRRGADRGLPRLLWTRCAGTCSARQGTASCGVRAAEPHDPIAMRALAEGHALRGPGHLVESEKDTVGDGRDRAGRPGRAVTTSWFDPWPLTECHGDAWWSFVRQKEAPRTVAENVRARSGEAWGWSACAPAWRLVAAFVGGKRAQEHGNMLRKRLQAVSCGSMPFFPRDPRPHEAHALLHGYGIPEGILPSPGQRGPKP